MKNLTQYFRPALRFIGTAAIIGIVTVAILNQRSGLPEGTQAPAIAGHTLDGQPYLEQHLGKKPIVVNFWATWCNPCIGELPDLEKAYQKFGDRVAFVGLVVESGDRHQVAAAVKRYNITYPVVLPHKQVQSAYQVTTYPTTIIVHPNGMVAHSHTGPIDFDLLQDDLAEFL